jgi:hypothetical protein
MRTGVPDRGQPAESDGLRYSVTSGDGIVAASAMRIAFTLLLVQLLHVSPSSHVNSYKAEGAWYEAATEQEHAHNDSIYAAFSVGEIEAKTEQRSTYDPREDALYRTYLVFTIVGVLGAVTGIIVIGLQTSAIRKSAQATEKSVKLQEVSLRQWVNLIEWEAQVAFDENDVLEITFSVANPTKVPLTLEAILVQVGSEERKNYGIVSVLAPENPFIVSTSIKLSREQRDDYYASQLVLNLKCWVTFIDCLGNGWVQTCGRRLGCLPRGVPQVRDTENRLIKSDVETVKKKN